ncbi:WD40-repeat-containing domain protein [Phaeosphaeriaceae sp. PMI808]|nr:WD40-repeat-containing domain protein [Phaeosphaeriaceae sp. PMI808]
MVKIWDAGSGECLQTLEGHSHSVNSVAFSHDSTRIASASHDNMVKIWDAGSGECLQTLEGHSNWVNSVAFSYDSTRIASASRDNMVKIWDTSSGHCLQTLDVGRSLSHLSFDSTGYWLHTEIGAVVIGGSAASNWTIAVTEPQLPQYQCTALSSDSTWITYNSKKVLWLPSEYRPSSSAVSGSMIGIGVGIPAARQPVRPTQHRARAPIAPSTPRRDPSTPPAPTRGRTRKPSAKVLEAQQSLRTQTTLLQTIRTRNGTAESQLSQNDEETIAVQPRHDKLQSGPTRSLSILRKQAGDSSKLERLVELIASLNETIKQQSSVIENIRSDLTTIKAEQQYLKDQNAELQETIGSLRAQLDTLSIEPPSTQT